MTMHLSGAFFLMDGGIVTDLSQLTKLQEVDTALVELEHQKGALPKKVEELTRIRKELLTSIEKNQERLKEIVVEVRQIQGMETDKKEKTDRLQNQLYLVKTNREYDALMSEIDHLKAEIDEKELKELELSEEKERLEEQVKLDSLRIEQMVAELSARRQELEETIASTEKEHKELMLRRETLTPSIDARHMALYDRVRGARKGVAVVPVVDHSCGGCHSRLTSQSIVEIRDGDRVDQCPVCRRILFWLEE